MKLIIIEPDMPHEDHPHIMDVRATYIDTPPGVPIHPGNVAIAVRGARIGQDRRPPYRPEYLAIQTLAHDYNTGFLLATVGGMFCRPDENGTVPTRSASELLGGALVVGMPTTLEVMGQLVELLTDSPCTLQKVRNAAHKMARDGELERVSTGVYKKV